MIDKLMTHFLQCGMDKEVLDAVKRSYLEVSDSSQVYEVMKKSFQSRQGCGHKYSSIFYFSCDSGIS